MKKYFEFINSIDSELEKMCLEFEELLYSSYTESIKKGVQISKFLIDKICVKEELNYLLEMSQSEVLHELYINEVIENEVIDEFNSILLEHHRKIPCKEGALKVHKNIFKILEWYFHCYINGKEFYETKEYIEPNCISDEYMIDKKIHYMKGDEDILEKSTQALKDYPFQQMDGSYLLNELSKLRQSSNEAVEGSSDLSQFKSYLHIKRSIQDEFIDVLKCAAEKDGMQLVMLCGSVGDGKSHLLAYVNKNYPELMNNFSVHNDATESFDPKKDTLETLSEILSNFNDSNINCSNDKMILAINLGVLNNFLESEYCDKDFKKLKAVIDKANIFNEDTIATNYTLDYISIISFNDYNLFELTEKGAESSYISHLLDKVVSHNIENPFYLAFNKDLKSDYHSPIILNYQLLMNEEIRQGVVNILVQSLIENKKIVSTRELLNFIYEIMVPTDITKFNRTDSILNQLNTLLPNLIFDNKDRSSLLSIINKNDPISIRNQMLDEFLINLDISTNIAEVIENELNLEHINFFMKDIAHLSSIYDLSIKQREQLSETLIRFSYFLGKKMKSIYKKKSYEDYIHYLYYYNLSKPKDYKQLFKEIKNAVFKWKGIPKKEYIILRDINGLFEVSQKLNFKEIPPKNIKQVNKLENRFKTTIKIDFQTINGDIVTINLDYKLYEIINRINKGYCPNKNDRENLLVFDEFIGKLVKSGVEENNVYIKHSSNDITFILNYENGFGEDCFKFERMKD